MNLILRTDRLLLRPLADGDIDICLALFTDPEVMKYVRAPKTRKMVEDDLVKICQRGGGGAIGVWCVTDCVTGEKLGTSVLLPLPVDQDDHDWSILQGEGYPPGEIEVGYILKPSAWGRGIASEACARLLRFAFEETPLEEIVAVTDPDNAASQNVLTKCGLVRQHDRRAYNHDDVPAFRISKVQWLARQARS
ncbi:MAG: GNAT family N-acetyltransferase [Rhizobiales bacterium]|nr:GNAT family N-acetyltransferase [Hyphomicrobiales bacterium]